MLVQLNGVSKSYGSHSILRDATFQINPGEKIGLIGPNGSGKTTLLKILSAKLEPDAGFVSRKTALRTGTLDQIPDFQSDTTVLEEGLEPFKRLLEMADKLQQTGALAPEDEEALRRLERDDFPFPDLDPTWALGRQPREGAA